MNNMYNSESEINLEEGEGLSSNDYRVSEEENSNLNRSNILQNQQQIELPLSQQGVTRIEPTDEFQNQVKTSLANTGIKKIKDNLAVFIIAIFFSSMLTGFSVYSIQKPQFFPFLTIPILGLSGVIAYGVHQRKKMSKVASSADIPIIQVDAITIDLSRSFLQSSPTSPNPNRANHRDNESSSPSLQAEVNITSKLAQRLDGSRQNSGINIKK